VEQPAVVADRYARGRPPGTLPVAIGGSTVAGDRVTVTGSTAPHARVVVASTPTDVVAATARATTTADAAGRFTATVRLGFLSNVVTVAADRRDATGYARTTVVSEALPGPVLLDVADPAGDDHGPGTFAYPLAADFADGAFDLRRFQVIDGGDTVYLLTRLRDLTPTFGSPLGAQLLDVFVRDPAAPAFSTAAPFRSRNYRIAPGSAWSARIEAQGFAAPQLIGPDGRALAEVRLAANAETRSILLSVPKAALGTPGAGWVFTVALHGQDGFSPDQARGFETAPQDYRFGLCPAGAMGEVCSIDPAAAPKVMDTITPPGVAQADVLNPLAPPVELQGVVVP
jgi:glucoamylase